MSSDWLQDSTFFNDVNLQTFEQNEPANEKSTMKRNKNPKKSLKESKADSTFKENSKVEGKTGRAPKKSQREPLKVLNTKVNTPAKNLALGAGKPTSSPRERIGKKKEGNPKIVVYSDSPAPAEGKEQKPQKKPGSRGSRSVGGSAERSNADGGKGKLPVGEGKRCRRSLTDLVAVKRLSKESKLPNYKPGHPEYEEIVSKIENLFPGADPEFLKSQLTKFKGSLLDTIEFLFLKKTTGELPSRHDYLKRVETEKLEKKVLEDFTVENFLSEIPDPWEHFLKKEKETCSEYAAHSLHYLKNKYKRVYVKTIQETLTRNQFSLYLSDKEINKKYPELKLRATNRSKFECDSGKPPSFDLRFIQEVAFVENEAKLKSFVRKEKIGRMRKAKEAGTSLHCQSCQVFDLLAEDAVACAAGHAFCKDCIVKYIEIEMNKEEIEFKCLLKCKEKFQMEMLENAFCPLVMDNIINRNQLLKPKDKRMENLVCCPFCSCVTFMPPKTSVLECKKPGCMMKSCRYCKQSNHIPLQCFELDKLDSSILDEMRKEQEQMDDNGEKEEVALDAFCMQCKEKLVKKEDSVQLVCLCGAVICALCQKPYPECEHFNVDSSEGNVSVDSEEMFSHNEHEISSDESETLIQF